MGKGKHKRKADLRREARDDARRLDLSHQLEREKQTLNAFQDELDTIPPLINEINQLRQTIDERDRSTVAGLQSEIAELLAALAHTPSLDHTDSELYLIHTTLHGRLELFEDVLKRGRELLWQRYPEVEQALERDLAKDLFGNLLLMQPNYLTAIELSPRQRTKLKNCLSDEAWQTLERVKRVKARAQANRIS